MRLSTFVASEHAKPRERIENICGVLVHVRPDLRQEIHTALTGISGVEVHTMTDDGRMVVTVEDAGGVWAGAKITSFNDIRGVLNVALVYHHFDSDLEGETAS